MVYKPQDFEDWEEDDSAWDHKVRVMRFRQARAERKKSQEKSNETV